MQDEDEEAYRQRYLNFLQEVEAIAARFREIDRRSGAIASPVTALNESLEQTLALADAIDRFSDIGARKALVQALKMVSSANADAIDRRNSNLNRREQIKRKRLEYLVAAYEQNLGAAKLLGDTKYPSAPGMESAYAIAGNLGGDFPHLSPDAIEQLRFRMAREAERTERGRYAIFDSDNLTFVETGGPILNLLGRLPKKRGRPRRSANPDSK